MAKELNRAPNTRGSNKNIIASLGKFLPKGKSLLDYDEEHYIKIMNRMNNLPRKTLNY